MLVFNRFYFMYAGRDCCPVFSISHVNFSEVTSVWGISAVAVLDCSLNVYACCRQKALTMPAYYVAANCNNSQATQSITTYEFQSGICGAVHRVTGLEKNPVRISKNEADEQQAHSVIPKIERYTDTLKQALTRQRQKV